MTTTPETHGSTTARECVCGECGATFSLPVIAQCPACRSRQVRRRDTTDAMADALRALVKRPQDREARETAATLIRHYDDARS